MSNVALIAELDRLHHRATDLRAREAQLADAGENDPASDTWKTAAIVAASAECEFHAALVAAWPTISRVLREAAEGWRPIETAPKDGTRVLLFGPRTDGSGNYQDVGGWWRNNWRPFEDDYCAFNHPHYWRPLPSPPSETGNDH